MSSTSRQEWVDSARGTAILGVVCIHTCGGFLYRTPPNIPPGTWWFLTVLTAVSKVGVPLFLMLSGTVNLGSPSKSQFDRAYMIRLLRILVPFGFWALVYMSIKPSGEIRRVPWNDVLGILNGQVYYHLWFIYSIIGLYMITPVLNAFVIAIGERQSLLVGGILLGATGLAWSLENAFQYWLDANLFKPLPVYAGYYILGYGLRSVKVTRRLREYSVMAFVVSSVFSLLITDYLNHEMKSFDNRGFHNLNPVVMVMSIAAFLLLKPVEETSSEPRRSSIGPVFALLGRGSFGVYLSHVLLLESAFHFGYWRNRLVQETIPIALLVPVTTILITLVSWLGTTGFSKIPVVRRLV